ncbi:MAG: cytochrome c biogenesis protein [Bacteroidetes bacterium]|nr:cytochrome c biogenesis protein [Bacteroidota bacterium]
MKIVRVCASVCLLTSTLLALSLPVVPSTQLFFALPYIVGLGETVRILFFHVPLAWTSMVAFVFSLFYGMRFLTSRKMLYDVRASIAAELGFLFCMLATITGSMWAKVTWGSFWNWDPRETSILILLLIYSAYFALRSAIVDYELRARLSSAYSIFSGVGAFFLIFVLPRITSGLHPGAHGDEAGVVPLGNLSLSATMVILLILALCGFTLLYFWMFSLKLRVEVIEESIVNQKAR